MRALAPVLLLLTLACSPQASADAPTHTPAQATDAVDQPGSRKVVFRAEAGRAYPLLKRGGPGDAWCKLQGPRTQQGWVPCATQAAAPTSPKAAPAPRAEPVPRAEPTRPSAPPPGEGTPRATTSPQGTARGCATTCSTRPLFPTPPPLSAQDREVLSLCPANPAASVTAPELRRFLARHYDDPRVQQALSAAGRPGNREANLDWLTSLWVGTGPRNAFTHVFCGDDWSREHIGGLHFLPRYAQLEAEGKLCYGGPVRGGQALRGEQYLIRFRGTAPWSCAEKPLGGFTRSGDAVGLLATGTRAFVRCCARGGQRREGGVYAGPDSDGTAWRVYCGTRNGTYGIATLYPTDERPTCSE